MKLVPEFITTYPCFSATNSLFVCFNTIKVLQACNTLLSMHSSTSSARGGRQDFRCCLALLTHCNQTQHKNYITLNKSHLFRVKQIKGIKLMHILGHFPSSVDLKLVKTNDILEAGSASIR
jgi:hypothetical protein